MDDQLEVEEDGTPVSIRDAVDDSIESYLIREPSLPVQYANCSGADVNIFASSEGISALRALHYCVGCAIRLEHLNIEVTKEYINGITLAVGGFNNRNAKIIAKLLKDTCNSSYL